MPHALTGKPCGWFAPNYRLLAAAWRDIVAIVGHVADPNKVEKIIVLPGGGSLNFGPVTSISSQKP